MKQISDLIVKHRLLFESLEPFPLSHIGSRKRLECYIGVDRDRYYHIIFLNPGKTRVLKKDIEQLNQLIERVEVARNHKIVRRILFSYAPICSKAKALFQQENWRMWNVSM